MQHFPSLYARCEGRRWLAPLVVLVTLAGAAPAHGFTLRLGDVVAFAQTETPGTPLPPMQLTELDYFNVISSQESVSTVAWDFGAGVVGSAVLDGEHYDVVSVSGFTLMFLDVGNPRTQFGAQQGNVFWSRSSNPTEMFFSIYTNTRYYDYGDGPTDFETDAFLTLTLIAGTGTPENFTPNGDEWANSAMLSQSVEEAVVPEPGSAALLAAGLAAGCLMRALRSRQRLPD